MQAADLFDYLMRFRDGEPRSLGWEPHHETAAAPSVKRHSGLACQSRPVATHFHDALHQLTNNAQKIGRKL